MWHRHAGLLEFHCVVSTFIWSHLLPLNLFKRLNVSGNETGLSGQITTSKEYHSSPTIEQKKDVYRALFAQFYRLSGKPTKVYTRKSLQQRQFTPDSVYTRHRIHQTRFTPDVVYTRQSQQRFTPEKVYTIDSLHQTAFTPDTVYTRHGLHQTWWKPLQQQL